jgi:hypothetical protein
MQSDLHGSQKELKQTYLYKIMVTKLIKLMLMVLE